MSMLSKTDKVILTNLEALKAKYGNSGVANISTTINSLIASDKQRGLATQLIALDDAGTMKKLGATRVTNAGSPKQNKDAIDAVYKALAPDYLLILGAIDVVPHQDLQNPMYDPSPNGDPDKTAFGDLPYACEAPYSQNPQDFFGPTRVLGRLPDVTGGKEEAYLVGLVETAASAKSSAATQYHPYFGITAQIWEKSTALSLTHTFGSSSDLKDVPPNNEKWPTQPLGRVSHFINCHGASVSSQFYGQPSSGQRVYPVALDAAYIDGKIAEGTVGAAECCYGGELFDPALLKGQQGICNTYLANKAYGFFASTTIAYGPSDSNAQADLICQYFLQSVLRGASLGRAALEARQNFVRAASPPDPSDIKTLAQFNLYGDPSITPVQVPSPVQDAVARVSEKAVSELSAERVERLDRRKALFRLGVTLAATEPRAYRERRKPRKSVETRLRNKAGELGVRPSTILSFVLKHPRVQAKLLPKKLRAKETAPDRFYVVFGESERAQTERVVSVVALIAKEIGGEVVSVSRVESR
jgi:hypothetical protein